MTAFLFADRGRIVNLAHVAYAEPSPGGNALLLYGATGTVLGRTTTIDAFDLALLAAPVVPAAHGSFATVIACWAVEGSIRARPDEAYAYTLPIAAWRVPLDSAAVPVLADDVSNNEIVLLPTPDGRLIWPNNQAFENLEDAKRCILASAQGDWDQANQPKRVAR